MIRMMDIGSGIALVAVVAAMATPSAQPPRAGAFEEFPLGVEETVRFQVDDPVMDSLNSRERADQQRDWLLFTVLRSARLPAAEMYRATFDRPAVRYGFMRQVGNLEYGTTRSSFAGDGMVVALLPAGQTSAARTAALGAVADRHRKDVGTVPDSITPFEYTLDGDSARVRRTATVPGRELYTEAAGYHERRVASAADLEAAVAAIHDLTFARRDGDALVVGGRTHPGDEAAALRLEDVSALWHSQLSMQGSGFSLDPVFDTDSLHLVLDQTALGIILQAYADSAQFAAVDSALTRGEIDPYLAWADSVRRAGKSSAAQTLIALSDQFSFQAARYDGDLQGTEVAMTLFYTDLVAKLWALNYARSTPGVAIPDFLAVARQPISHVFQQQLDSLTNTRLWFGPRDAGFQQGAAGNELYFAHLVTRVYAASASAFTPGVEVPANAESESFLGWWNDHYDEVAAYEPEYERLNQIMKWSLLVGWINHSGVDALEYLAAVDLNTSHWFPEWVRGHPELKFARWETLEFFPAGHKHSRTEALPLLVSPRCPECPDTARIEGGVSLGTRESFAERQLVSRELSPELRRPVLKSSEPDGLGGLRLETLEGERYTLSTAARDGIHETITPSSKVRLTSPAGEVARGDLERTFSASARETGISTALNGNRVGELSLRDERGTLVAAWRGAEISTAQRLATSLGTRADDDLVRAVDEVAEAHRAVGSGDYYLRMDATGRWAKIARRRVPTVDLPNGATGRWAGADRQTRLVTLMDDAAARAEMEGKALITVKEGHVDPPEPAFPFEDVRAAALRASEDPDAVRAAGQKYLDEAADAGDQLLRRGHTRRAQSVLQHALGFYPYDPRLRFQEIVTDLETGDTRAAAADLSELQRTIGPRDRPHMLREIAWSQQRYARDQELAWKAAGYADFASLPPDQVLSGTMHVRAEGRRLVTSYELLDPLEGHWVDVEMDPAAEAEIESGDANLYVANDPSLSNLDWSHSGFRKTLHETVSGRRGTMHELPRGALGQFSPEEVYAAAAPQPERLVRRSTVRYRGRVYNPFQPDHDCDRDSRPQQCRRSYAIVPSAAQ